jgi:putative addiction module component (TIGR02574 family)
VDLRKGNTDLVATYLIKDRRLARSYPEQDMFDLIAILLNDLKRAEIWSIIRIGGGQRSMMGTTDILRLSISERIQLVQDIWDSIAELPDSVPLTDEQKAELDQRLDAYHRDPNIGSPWAIVRERFKSRT